MQSLQLPSQSQLCVNNFSTAYQAQKEALAAQTQAVAAQHLPTLKTSTGKGRLFDADSFKRWLENFEEQAKLVGWNEAQQLHQMKLLLDETALHGFHMFSEEDRRDLG